MTVAVDLPRVAHARAALAALVRAHPELTMPAAQTRAARWLSTLEGTPDMSRKLSDERTVQLGIRLPESLLAALNARVEQLTAALPAALRGVAKITASDVVRDILARELAPADASAPPADASPPPAPTLALAPPPSPAPVQPALALAPPPAPDLRARFDAAAAADRRINNSAAGRALGTTEVMVRRWRKHAGELAPELADRLAGWLSELGQ